MTIFCCLTDGEHLHELKEALCNSKQTGLQLKSVSGDGAVNILRAVREVCPEAILQRCTVHIALEIKTWLTKKPQITAAELIGILVPVQTHSEAQLWITACIDRYLFFKSNVDKI